MSNDAITTRSEIERIDWANIASICLKGGEYVTGEQIRHETIDRRRKVRQVFTVSLVETPMEDVS